MKYNSFAFDPYKRFFLPTLLFLFVMNFLAVICTYESYTCDESSHYSNGSTYSTNLNLVISDLFRNAPQSSGFNTSSHGQSPNKVYGLLQCTGNITAVRCSNCVQEANHSIQQLCSNDIGGRIWLDDCFLRYGSSNFISILDTDGPFMVNGKDISGNIDAFQSTVITLLSDLSKQAFIPANKGFAAGSANYSASGKLYSLVQCWRDISIQDCRTCLAKAKPRLEYSRKQGARVLFGSCMARYEIYSFFSSAQSPSPSPEGSTPTTSRPPLPPTSKKYAMRGQLSVKVDVYSFGVVLLEIVSGRRNNNSQYQMESLVEWAWKLFKGGNGSSVVDSKVSEATQEQALRCIHVGLLCVQADATLRPAMSNVVMMISRRNGKLPNPSKPAFVTDSKSHASKSKSIWGVEEYEKGTTSQTSGTTSSSSSGIRSVYEASITEMEAR